MLHISECWLKAVKGFLRNDLMLKNKEDNFKVSWHIFLANCIVFSEDDTTCSANDKRLFGSIPGNVKITTTTKTVGTT